MHRNISHQHLSSLLLVLMLSLSGCGGGSGTASQVIIDPPAVMQDATVTVLLTDAPRFDFDHIFVTISAIELIGIAENVILFEGMETVDLLMLEKFADLFAVTDGVPAGSYNKIRLILDDVELVRLDTDGNVLESVHPDLPANGKLDLNPRGSFNIEPGENVLLQLDIDAQRSIHISSAGNGGYKFRPVVFIDILNGSNNGKAVRVNGRIMAIDAVNGTLDLCQRHPTSADSDNDSDSVSDGLDDSDEDRDCVTVRTSDGTGFYDSSANSAGFADLMIGDTVLMIGDSVPGGAPLFDATIIAINTGGVFKRFEGVVQTASDARNYFDFLLEAGQGFAADTLIAVEVQPGTGIADDDGNSLDVDSVQPGVEADLDGVIVLSDTGPDVLRAIYMALDVESGDDDSGSDGEARISGQVVSVEPASNSLILVTTTGDRCVTLAEDADLFLISIVADTSTTEHIDLSDIMIDATADAYGNEKDTGCLQAQVILITG